ncbi:MAG: integrase, partial [Heliomarina sp.]
MSSPTNNSTKIEDSDASGAEISSSASYDSLNGDEHDKRTSRDRASIALPANVAGSGALDRLIDTARGYAEASTAGNTNKAYAADWKHFSRWCRLKGTEPLPPAPEMIGLYVADLAAPTGKAPTLSVSTIERRLSGLAWNYRQRGFTLDRKDRHIATVLAGIKRKHARPPVQKEAILPEDIQAMVATLSY